MTIQCSQNDPRKAIAIRLFGGFYCTINGRTVDLPVSAQRVLAFVALRTGVGRSEAAARLWPDATEAASLACLRTALWRSSSAGVGAVSKVGGRLTLASGVHVDTTELGTLVRQLATDRPGAAELDAALASAFPTGDLLPDWNEDWVLFERERLRQLRLHALELTAQELQKIGRYAVALDLALTAVAIEPLRESAHRVVIQTHIAEGNLAEARRHFSHLCQLLRDELGIAPSSDLAASVVVGGRPRPTRQEDGWQQPRYSPSGSRSNPTAARTVSALE